MSFYIQKANPRINFTPIHPEMNKFGAFFDLITLPNKLAYYSFLTRKITIFVSLFQEN